MNRAMLTSLPALSAAVTCCALAGSCATALDGDAAEGFAPQRPRPIALQVAQAGQASRARFATCAQKDCPTATPKTVAGGIDTSPPDRRFAAPTPVEPPTTAILSKLPLLPAPAPLATTQDDAREVTKTSVTFAFGSAELTGRARASLDEAVSAGDITQLTVRGRTDSTGPDDVNRALAEARARAAEAHLRRAHPHLASRIAPVEAAGACCYVADNDTPAGRAANRRVEIEVERRSADP